MPRPARLLTAAAITSLLVVSSADAHVTVTPSFLAVGEQTVLTLDVPNERETPMKAFEVALPRELSVVSASAVGAWRPTTTGRTVSWSGGALAADETASFPVTVTATGEPGAVELAAVQGYADGGTVPWTVQLTVVPGSVAKGGGHRWALALLFVSLIVLAASIAFTRARRARSLQER